MSFKHEVKIDPASHEVEMVLAEDLTLVYDPEYENVFLEDPADMLRSISLDLLEAQKLRDFLNHFLPAETRQ